MSLNVPLNLVSNIPVDTTTSSSLKNVVLLENNFQKRLKIYDKTCNNSGRKMDDVSLNDLTFDLKELLSDENRKNMQIVEHNKQLKTLFHSFNKHMEQIAIYNVQLTKFDTFITKYEELKKECVELYVELETNSPSGNTFESDFFLPTEITDIKDRMFDITSKINDETTKASEYKKYIINYKELFSNLINDINDDNKSKLGASEYICTICYVNTINTCLNPCGHLFCDECVDKHYSIATTLSISTPANNLLYKCPTCRRIIKSKIKMFFQNDTNNVEAFSDPSSLYETFT